MNPEIKELAVKAQLEHCVSHVRLQEFADLILYKVLDVVANTDTRDFVYTTFDKGMADSTVGRVEATILQKFNLTKKYETSSILC